MTTGCAGPVSRILAYLVDTFTVAAIFFAALAAAPLVGTTTGWQVRVPPPVAGTALPVLFVGYQAAFWSLTGRTPGMALLGLRVVTTRHARPSPLASLARAAVLAVFPVGFLWSLVDRRRQAVHDKLSRTLVVYR